MQSLDVTGESFGQRMQQYVRFYSGDFSPGDPIRLTAGYYLHADTTPLQAIVDRALGKTDEQAIPISPDNLGALPGHRPPPGATTGHYPAASHLTPARG